MGIQMNARGCAVGGPTPISGCGDSEYDDLKPNERLVYDALRQSETPQKAYELLERLHDRGLRAPMTIYRALDGLIEKRRVSKIESLNAFIAVVSTDPDKALAFLICKNCSKVNEIALEKSRVSNLFSPSASVDDIRIEAFVDCHKACGG